jgi:membrane protease YdiL (CAAX protease family)
VLNLIFFREVKILIFYNNERMFIIANGCYLFIKEIIGGSFTMQRTKKSFREKTEKFVTKPYFIVTLICVSFLSFLVKQPGTLLFYITIFITLWAKRWDWSYIGFTKPNWPKIIIKAFLFSICLFILSDILILPLLELYFGRLDLSGASHIEGNLSTYVLYLLLGWIIGGFAEEIIYRGYVVKRLAIIFGDTNKTWLLSAIIASVGFGLAHFWLGTVGMISAGFVSFILGLIFVYNRNNLMLLVLVHGIYDMIAITLIYLGKASMITDWVHDFIK